MKQTKRHRTGFTSAVILLVTVGLLVLLSIALYNHTRLETRFDTMIAWFSKIDNAIAQLDTTFEIVLCIFALYIAKCQLPIPLSVCCVISGMVFPLSTALALNVLFIFFFFTVKYVEGTFLGGGWTGMILNIKKLKFVRDWIHFKGNGNPYVLAVTRLVPFIPVGMVSKYYGSMHYDFVYYSLLSLLGFAPRLFVYTKLGASWTNPFSVTFITLVMVIVAFSGISSLIFNIFYGVRTRQMTQTLLIYSEKNKYKIVL